MFHVTREIDFCYGHRLLNYEGKCRHLHGHNGRALITLESLELDERGMVLDFGDIKAVMNTWVDDNLDHRMILCRQDPAVELLKKLDVQETNITCVAPSENPPGGTNTFTFEASGSAEEYGLNDLTQIAEWSQQPVPGDYSFSIQSQTASGLSPFTGEEVAPVPPGLPTALAEYVSAVHGRPTTFNFSGDWTNSIQPYGSQYGALTVAGISSQPADGNVSFTGDSITYTSHASFVGTDTFSYQITNGQTTSAPIAVTVNVTETAPIAYTIPDQVPTSGCVVAYDADGDSLTYQLVAESGCSVTLNEDGTFTAVIDPSATDVWFTYRASDGLEWSNVAEFRYMVTSTRNGIINTGPVCYSLTVQGCMTRYQFEGPDSGWGSAQIIDSPNDGSLVANPDGLSFDYTPDPGFHGTDWFTYTFTTGAFAGEILPVVVTVTPSDFLSIDSDNTDKDVGFAQLPDLPDKQNLALPGKIIPLDNGDTNHDGIPGYADGYDLNGIADDQTSDSDFVPIQITLPANFDTANGQIQLSYSASDPSQVSVTGNGTSDDPYDYRLPSDGGALRIWTKCYASLGLGDYTTRTAQPFSDRSPSDPSNREFGFYMPPGTYDLTDMEELGLVPPNGSWPTSFTLWIERVRPSQSNDEREISLSVDPYGTGDWSAADCVVVGDAPSLNVDALDDSGGSPDPGVAGDSLSADLLTSIDNNPSTPGKIIVVDDADTGHHGIPDFARGVSGNASYASDTVPFVPLVVTLPEGVDPATAQLVFDYSGSDPAGVTNLGSSSNPDYQPAAGSLRLWTEDGTQDRDDQGINDGGDYITPNEPFDADLLSWQNVPDSLEQQATIYIEAIRASTATGDLTIQYSLDADGNGVFTLPVAVHVTAVQDTVPDYSGSGLAGVAQGADGGNPMSNAYSGAVRLSDGIVNYATTDFSVPGTGFARTVSRIWCDQPGLVVNPSFGNGEIMTQLPYLIQATGSIIAVIDGQPYYFDQVLPNVYQERFFGLEQLTYNATAHQYTFTDTTGTRIVFNDFSVQNENDLTKGMYERGAMKSVTDADGNTITVTQYDTLGNTTKVTEGGDVFTYTYASVGDYAELLSSVSLARNGYTIARAQYTYYAADDPYGNGNAGDLEQVRVWTSASATAPLQEVGGSYYRYSIGSPDDLWLAVTGLAYASFVAAAGSPTSLDSANVVPYADQFGYDDLNRLDFQVIMGAGASFVNDLSAGGTFTYDYDTDGQSRGVGINAWSQETTINLPGDAGATQAVYTNYAGEPMLSALTDSDDAVSPALDGLTWNTFFAYDPEGRLLLTAEPSTPIQVDDSNPDLLDEQTGGSYQLMSSDQGLIEGIDYYGTSGATPGYVEDTYVQNGQQASTKALQNYYQYATISGDGVTIHPVSDDTVFSAATANTGDSSGRDTHFDYQSSGLHVTRATETLPPVSAGQNGLSGTGTIITNYDSNGRVQNVTDADGYTTTYSYDNPTGTVTQTVTVVNLTTGATITTSAVPDLLGRPVQTTDGNGDVTNIRYDDGLLQSTVTTTPVGGPTQTVVNNAAQGTITTTATTPDGSMQAVSEVWLDYAGRTVQTYLYDGLGTAPEVSEDMYDLMGELYWTEDAEGTITQTDFDGLGRETATWVGPASTDDMVEMSATVYDNGGVGDGNVTESIDFPSASSSAPGTLDVTQMFYDWQDRLVATKSGAMVGEQGGLADGQGGFQVDGISNCLVLDPAGEGTGGDATQRPITYDVLDNLGEVLDQDVYDGNGVSLTYSGGVPDQPLAGLLRAETANSYNAQGQEYESEVYNVNQTSGIAVEITSSIYDGDGNVISTTDPRGSTTTDTYDGLGELLSTTDPKGTTRYTYNGDGNQLTETDPDGNVTSNAYNDLDQLVSTTDGRGYTTHYTYDAAGNQDSTTDPLGNTTTEAYDALGQLVSTSDAKGDTTRYTYDDDGNLLSRTDPLGNVTTNAYNDLNQLVSTTDANGTTSYTYDDDGNVTSTTDPLGNTTTEAYDALGQLVSTTDAKGETTSYTYDADGNQLSQTDPLEHTTTNTYDAFDQLLSTTDAKGETTSYTYDGDGNQLTSTDAKDETTSYTYDADGNQLSETDPDGNTTSYVYDPDGNKVGATVTPSSGAVTSYSWQYDADGDCTQYTDADNRTSTYTYNLDDQLTGEDWYAAPSSGVPGALGTLSNTVSYGYNSLGQLTSEGDNFSSSTYQYDALGRRTAVASANPGQPTVVLSSGYDAAGSDAVGDDLRTSLSANIGGTLNGNGTVSGGTPDFLNTYAYDGDGNLLHIVQQGQANGNGVTEKQVNFGYDQDNQLTSIDRYQVDTSHLVAHSQYTYDACGDLTGLTDTAPNVASGSTLPAYVWSYDADGRVTDEYSLADTSGTPDVSDPTTWAHAHYNYDADGQLSTTVSSGGIDFASTTTYAVKYSPNWQNAPQVGSTANTEDYGYDANGNQTSNSQQVGNDNELQSDGTYTYTYDADGNCTSRTLIAGTVAADHTTLYTWDNRNRLTAVTYENNAGQITSMVQDTYDVENRWIGEAVTTYSTPGNLATGTTTRQEFVYDGNQIVLSFSGNTNSSLTNRYLWGPAVDQLLAQESPLPPGEGQGEGSPLQAGAVDWALTDNLGTVRDMAVYNPSTDVTAIAMHRVYTSFGNLVYQGNPSAGSVAAADCLFGFTGRPFDKATGLENTGNRWYNPATQRWLSQDPSGLGPGPNPYDYCGNGPTDGTDPSGMQQANGSSTAINPFLFPGPIPGLPTSQELAEQVAREHGYTGSSPLPVNPSSQSFMYAPGAPISPQDAAAVEAARDAGAERTEAQGILFGNVDPQYFAAAQTRLDQKRMAGMGWPERIAYSTFRPGMHSDVLGGTCPLTDATMIAAPAAAMGAMKGQPTCGPGPVTVDETGPGALKGGANPAVQKAASRGSTLHSDRPGNLPDQLRQRFPDTQFEFTKPGQVGQDVKVVGGRHPSDYPGSNWPTGVDRADFKPDTPGGQRTFQSDQRNKWPDSTHMLPYDSQSGDLR